MKDPQSLKEIWTGPRVSIKCVPNGKKYKLISIVFDKAYLIDKVGTKHTVNALNPIWSECGFFKSLFNLLKNVKVFCGKK